MRVAAFDVIGTLVDLEPLRLRLRDAGVEGAVLEAWFSRTLQAAATLTLTETFQPFGEIARSSLETSLAMAGGNPARAETILEPLARGALPARDGALRALQAVSERSIPAIAVTNGPAGQTRDQLDSTGLLAYVREIVSTEDVRAYKPHPCVYRRLVHRAGVPAGDVTLVAAHGWDVLGARAAGLGGIWVTEHERLWPFPTSPPPAAPDLVTAAELLTGSTS